MIKFAGANPIVRDVNGISPLMMAAVEGNLELLNIFLDQNISNTARTSALELAASVLLTHAQGQEDNNKAFELLAAARTFREIENDGLDQEPTESEGATEWITTAPFEQIQANPEDYRSQALLIQIRILSGLGWGAVRIFLDPLFNHFMGGDVLFEEALDFYRKLLVKLSRFNPEERGLFNMITQIVKVIVENMEAVDSEEIKHNIEATMEAIIAADITDKKGADRTGVDVNQHLQNLLSLLMIVSRLDDLVLFERMKVAMVQLVMRDGRDEKERNLLLLACDLPVEPLEAVILLNQLNADPDPVDSHGNGPLHILATKHHDQIYSTARFLISAGTHLDRANSFGRTASDIWVTKDLVPEKKRTEEQRRKKRRLEGTAEGIESIYHYERQPVWYRSVVHPLKCLSAKMVKLHSHRMNIEDLPAELRSFVRLHS